MLVLSLRLKNIAESLWSSPLSGSHPPTLQTLSGDARYSRSLCALLFPIFGHFFPETTVLRLKNIDHMRMDELLGIYRPPMTAGQVRPGIMSG